MTPRTKPRPAASPAPRNPLRRLVPVGAFSFMLLGAAPLLLLPPIAGSQGDPDVITAAAIRAAAMATAPAALPAAALPPASVTPANLPMPISRPSSASIEDDADEPRRNPFIGEWRGVGWLGIANGPRERLHCRATHAERNAGEDAVHVLRCGNDRFQIELTSSLRQKGGRLSGSWRETNHNLRGGLSGTQNGEKLNLFMRADHMSASLHATVRGCQQVVGITINDWSEREGQLNLRKVGC